MIVEFEKGYKTKYDRKVLVTTMPKEPVTIFKLGLILNQIAWNEYYNLGKKNKVDIDNDLYFFKAMTDSMLMAWKVGVDWLKKENEPLVREWCVKNQVSFEEAEHLIIETRQNKLKFEEAITNENKQS